MKRRLYILISLTLLAAIMLSLMGGFISSLVNREQGTTFESMGTLISPTLDLAQQPGQYQVIIDTPPWMAPTYTPAPLSQPRSQAVLPSLLTVGLLVLLGGALVIALILLVARWMLKRGRETALQRVPPPDPPLLDRARSAGVRRERSSAPPAQPGAPVASDSELPVNPRNPPVSLLQGGEEGAELSDRLITGIQQVRQGQLDAGIQNLVPVVQEQPQEAEAWLWLGLAYIGKREWKAAERCLHLAEKLGHPQAAQALGMVTKLSAK